MPVDDSSAAGSRPVVSIDGIANDPLSSDLLEFCVEESVSMPTRCRVRFANLLQGSGRSVEYSHFGSELDFGRRFSVDFPAGSPDPVRLFEGGILSIEGSYDAGRDPEILIGGEDDLVRFRTHPGTRVFEHVTDKDIVQDIAADHGLATDIQLSGPTYDQVMQIDQSDFSFLRARVRRVGGILWLQNNKLTVREAGDTALPQTDLVFGKDLQRFDVRGDLRGQATELSVYGWSRQSKEAVHETSDPIGSFPGLSGLRSGGEILQEVSGAVPYDRLQPSVDTVQEAGARAQAMFRELAHRFVTGEGMVCRHPELRVGWRVYIRNVGPRFEGPYDLVKVRHRFDSSAGFRTEFEVERPWMGEAKEKKRKIRRRKA